MIHSINFIKGCDFLAVGPRPTDQEDWQKIVDCGMTEIIDLDARTSERKMAVRLGLTYVGLKVADPPRSMDAYRRAFRRVTKVLEASKAAGQRTYFHCNSGKLRSPACAVAYLVSSGRSLAEAKRILHGSYRFSWYAPQKKRLERSLDLWSNETRIRKRTR